MSRRVVVLLLALTACSGSDGAAGPTTGAARVVIVGGATQVGTAMFALPESLVVRVEDASGRPVAGVDVTWAVENRLAVIRPARTVSDANGEARAAWQMGVDEGEQRAVASVANLPSARFVVASRSADLREAGGDAQVQCGRYADDVVRCWEPPAAGLPRAVALDTDLRFTRLAFAGGEWCGTTRSLQWACFLARDLVRGGVVRPEAAPVRTIAPATPVFSALAGGAALEQPPTWCGVTLLGAVHCWGDNSAGQFGDGSIGGRRDGPGPPVPGVTAVRVAVADRTVCALAPTGTVACWGDAAGGAIAAAPGTGAVPTPTPVPTAERFFDLAGARGGTFCAVSSEIQAWCWGSGAAGGLGRNGAPATAVPVPVEGTEGYAAITASGGGFLALTVDRDLVVWGGLAPARTSATPFRVLRGLLFTGIIPGGGDGAVCLRAVPGGTRCLDRLTAVTAPETPPALHGVPEG